jgi:hypothetical protein
MLIMMSEARSPSSDIYIICGLKVFFTSPQHSGETFTVLCLVSESCYELRHAQLLLLLHLLIASIRERERDMKMMTSLISFAYFGIYHFSRLTCFK